MLVLTRKIGEEIVNGDTIRLLVLAVSGNKVRLGITAPTSIAVMRQELMETRHEQVPTTTPETDETQPRHATEE